MVSYREISTVNPNFQLLFDWPPISTKTIHIRVIAFLHHVSFYLIQIVKRCVNDIVYNLQLIFHIF